MKRILLAACIVSLAVLAPAFGCDKAAKMASNTDAQFQRTADNDIFYGLDGVVTPAVTKLDNGVKIVVTSNDAEALQKVQKRMGHCRVSAGCGDCPLKTDGVKRTVEMTDEGLVITATADSPELIEKIQAYANAVVKTASRS